MPATQDAKDKVEQYFTLIESRVIKPIRGTDISRSCTATLLLLFAAIDGLGDLCHERRKRGSGDRLKLFLQRLGPEYEQNQDRLYCLRNDIVHTALSVAAFMSALPEHAPRHLQPLDSESQRYVFINTSVFLDDFCRAFESFRAEVRRNTELLERAAARLELDYVKEFPSGAEDLTPAPTPPPPIWFVRQRRTS